MASEDKKMMDEPDQMGIIGVPSESIQFKMFRKYLEGCLDEFKLELSTLTFPIYK